MGIIRMAKVKKMSISELQQIYPGPFNANNNNDLSLKDRRKLNIVMLKDQYNYYLTRYMNAYDQYLAYKSPYYGNNQSKANKLKPIVLQLNNTLLKLANNLKNSVNFTKSQVYNRNENIRNQNDKIALNYENQKVLNKVIKEKNLNNDS